MRGCYANKENGLEFLVKGDHAQVTQPPTSGPTRTIYDAGCIGVDIMIPETVRHSKGHDTRREIHTLSGTGNCNW
jgi:hypothetical protein